MNTIFKTARVKIQESEELLRKWNGYNPPKSSDLVPNVFTPRSKDSKSIKSITDFDSSKATFVSDNYVVPMQFDSSHVMGFFGVLHKYKSIREFIVENSDRPS